ANAVYTSCAMTPIYVGDIRRFKGFRHIRRVRIGRTTSRPGLRGDGGGWDPVRGIDRLQKDATHEGSGEATGGALHDRERIAVVVGCPAWRHDDRTVDADGFHGPEHLLGAEAVGVSGRR